MVFFLFCSCFRGLGSGLWGYEVGGWGTVVVFGIVHSAYLSAHTKIQTSSCPGTSLKVFGGGGGGGWLFTGDFSVLLWSKPKVLFF